MKNDPDEIDALLTRAAEGNSDALNDLFEMHRERLKRMIRIRLNRRLHRRVDDSDVLQDAYLEASRRIQEYLKDPQSPFFLWLRQILSQRIIDAHRRHLGAEARDARMEISISRRSPIPLATSLNLAAQLIDGLATPSEAAEKAELRQALQDALDQMDEMDREILSLRHFEYLSNQEAAEELGIETSAASKRYIRALKRLQQILLDLGLVEQGDSGE